MVPKFSLVSNRVPSISKDDAESCCGFAVLRLPSSPWSFRCARPPSEGLALNIKIDIIGLRFTILIAVIRIKQTFPLVAAELRWIL